MLNFIYQLQWREILDILYIILVVFTCIRVVLDTDSVQKTMSYLLLVLFFPIVGIVLYFSIGINYRRRKIYNKKLRIDEKRATKLLNHIRDNNKKYIATEEKKQVIFTKVLKLLSNPLVSIDPIFKNNSVEILVNGEQAFPDILNHIKKAQHFIHLEYYIYENDGIGHAIKDALIEKAKQGVKVRFIYDDFGSNSIRRNIVNELNQHENIEAYAFHEIKLLFFANRLNYRNHRKIIIIDGNIGYTGGINVSDKYINSGQNGSYWRDTHVRIQGSAVLGLQHVFLSDWNFCSEQDLGLDAHYFPQEALEHEGESNIQIISSGPDSDVPTILYMYIQSINAAQQEILLTTPYYIPDNNLQQMLVLAALRGVNVKLLLPMEPDFKIVRWAAQAYYDELLNAGVEIYLYKKGFVHAKTMVVDRQFAFIGTANLDTRSFDLNFEVGAVIYDVSVAEKLGKIFNDDLKDAVKVDFSIWKKRSKVGQFKDKIIRLLSPLL